MFQWRFLQTVIHSTPRHTTANVKVKYMISYIAICLTRPMPLEVAEILGVLGLAVLVILAVGIAARRASE
jgi:hypothetical protein